LEPQENYFSSIALVSLQLNAIAFVPVVTTALNGFEHFVTTGTISTLSFIY
jgi:hypothetical protein